VITKPKGSSKMRSPEIPVDYDIVIGSPKLGRIYYGNI
jgi:hypothetical protein